MASEQPSARTWEEQPDLGPVRIFLRPLGSPVTLGLSGLAIASLVEAGLDLSWVATSQTREAGIVLVSVPFVLQLCACLFAYLARDAAAGASLGVLSTTWLGFGAIQIVSAPGSRSGALGLLLVTSAGVLALSATAVSTAKPLPGTVFHLAAIRFALTGAYQLGAGHAVQHAAGAVGIAVTALASYTVLAFELEEHRSPVLPTFRIRRGSIAVSGPPAAAIDDPVHDAGVRQTT